MSTTGQSPGDIDRRLVQSFPDPGVLPELTHEDVLPLLERWRLAAVGQLAAGAAHEINNPLFAILGTVEFLLEDAEVGTELRERLQRIQRAGLEIREVVRSLVEFAREPAASRRVLAVADVCAETVQLVRLATLAKGVEIRELYPPERIEVDVSPNQVKQILLGLLVNAQQAQPEGGEVELEVECREGEALVCVRDRGPGLSDGVRERIFEPFYTTRRDQGGSGLGLAVARGLARLQGGEIEVESEPGRGSTFTLRLPVAG